ncbi:hypothetical protein BG000_006266, partial [Podila horticola]
MYSEQKQEHLAEKEFVDEKHDIECSSVILDEEENSPIPDGLQQGRPLSPRADLPFLGHGRFLLPRPVLFNQFFWFRSNPMSISSLVIQLLSYPTGRFLARVLPAGRLNP